MSAATSDNIITLIGLTIVTYMILTTVDSTIEKQGTAGGYKTKYFPLSGGESLRVLNEMKDNKTHESTLQEFAQMEDALMKMEYNTVMGGGSYHIQGISLSRDIKERFMGYDFRYHDIHLKQMAEPYKLINKYMYV